MLGVIKRIIVIKSKRPLTHLLVVERSSTVKKNLGVLFVVIIFYELGALMPVPPCIWGSQIRHANPG